jgi:hypothetical protein
MIEGPDEALIMRGRASKRPPFENRWTSGKRAWVWHQELERLGVHGVRLRLAMHDADQPADFIDPDMPYGFVRDWLAWHERTERRAARSWLAVVTAMAALALIAGAIGAWPVLAR